MLCFTATMANVEMEPLGRGGPPQACTGTHSQRFWFGLSFKGSLAHLRVSSGRQLLPRARMPSRVFFVASPG